MPRIETITHDKSSGRLNEIYTDLIKKRGKLASVHTIQSLRPESIVRHMDLYLEIMFTKSDLTRAQREMIAVVVSVCNACEYCQIHHAEALNHYWKDDDKIKLLKNNYRELELNSKDHSLCEYAEQLTTKPDESKQTDFTESLKKEGLSDSAILDATLVIAYFNFVNRIVNGLDVQLEEDSGTGYKY